MICKPSMKNHFDDALVFDDDINIWWWWWTVLNTIQNDVILMKPKIENKCLFYKENVVYSFKKRVKLNRLS